MRTGRSPPCACSATITPSKSARARSCATAAMSPSSPAASKFRARWKLRSCWSKTASRRGWSTWRRSSRSTANCLRAARQNRRRRHGGRSQYSWRIGRRGRRSAGATRPCPIEFIGVKDVFGASGEPEELATLWPQRAAYRQGSQTRHCAEGKPRCRAFRSTAKRRRHRRQPRHRPRDCHRSCRGRRRRGAHLSRKSRRSQAVVREIEALGAAGSRSRWTSPIAPASKRRRRMRAAHSARFRFSSTMPASTSRRISTR
jgi:hypothetical protein